MKSAHTETAIHETEILFSFAVSLARYKAFNFASSFIVTEIYTKIKSVCKAKNQSDITVFLGPDLLVSQSCGVVVLSS